MDKDKVVVIVKYDPPPIPVHNFNWSAYVEDCDENGPVGYGSTKWGAISDLAEQMDNK